MTIAVVAVLFLLIGGALCRFFDQNEIRNLRAERDAKDAELSARMAERDETVRECAQLRTEKVALQTEKESLETRLREQREEAEKRNAELRADYTERLKDLENSQGRRMEEFKAQAAEQLKTIREHCDQTIAAQEKLIQETFRSSSEAILKERAEALIAENQSRLSPIITPLLTSLEGMRTEFTKNSQDQRDIIARLEGSFQEAVKTTRDIGDEARNLARALREETKTQGNFGESQLRVIFEKYHLVKGVHFEEQVTIANAGETEDHHRRIPDFILHFPDGRDVIVDAKVSLTAYMDYVNATDEEERKRLRAAHCESVRRHVKELADKRYYDFAQPGHAKLDFVLLYLYNDNALQTALAESPDLWENALKENVLIVGPTNIILLLRIIDLAWRQEALAKNQKAMLEETGTLIKRLEDFYKRLKGVKDKLEKFSDSVNSLDVIASVKGKSINTSARKLITLLNKAGSTVNANWLPEEVDDPEEAAAVVTAEAAADEAAETTA